MKRKNLVKFLFFGEIKFRAGLDLKDINPDVNLAVIWEQVDEWQKESELTPKEMTNKKLEEYVQDEKIIVLVQKSQS